jgi:ABC-2 type transport system permease protein
MHKVWAIIRREFVERVRTRWFWVSAILGPILFAGVIVFQIMQSIGGGRRNIAVVDIGNLGYGVRIAETLGASRNIRADAVRSGPGVLDSLTRLVEAKELNGFLIVGDSLPSEGKAEYRASNLSLQTIDELQRTLNRVVEKARLEGKGVNPTVVDWAQALRVTLDQKKCQRGACTTENAGQSFILAYVMAILLFMAILLYGVNVMSSVLEEKTTRIIEVLVSSLRPFQLMLGKVAGAGAVSFFQFVIWGVSARLLIALRVPIAKMLGASQTDALNITLPHIPFPTVAVFMAFFLGGFLLYSAMFAAVGAMSSNEQEARQAQQPVTYLLMISYFSIIGLTNEPASTFARTLSLIPFTSPIATPVRWTAGSMGTGELVASLALLLVGIVAVTWVAARIYRVGILMTGKRPNLKELVRWVRTA